MVHTEIVKAFADNGFAVSPAAISLLSSCENRYDIIQRVVPSLGMSVIVVDCEHITPYLGDVINDSNNNLIADAVGASSSSSSSSTNVKSPLQSESIGDGALALASQKDDIKPPSIKILSDISSNSTCLGEYSEFVRYFNDRYSRLSNMIRGRLSARPIEALTDRKKKINRSESEDISIIGMVSSIKTTSKGNKMFELEDPTGTFPVLVMGKDEPLFEKASTIVLDEVIGVTGSIVGDGGLFIVKEITWPDIPKRLPKKTRSMSKAILISDVHVGSNTFMKDEWLSFIDWLNGTGPGGELAKNVKYVIVAGDLVDGIGIYPGQESELEIMDVYDQYRKAAEYIGMIPKHIKVVISPGNHDIVRQAEPQPKLPEKITEMFSEYVEFIGSPAMIDVEGVRILVYHGRSIDDLIAAIPGMDYPEPHKIMIELLKRRHLSPIYGSKVSIAPEEHDHYVIDEIPDILHCGHVHTVGVAMYKGVLVANTGAWQSQTDFQKRVNLMPDPAKAVMVDLSNMNTQILDFMHD